MTSRDDSTVRQFCAGRPADLIAEHAAGHSTDCGAGVIAVGVRIGDGVTGHGAGGGPDGGRDVASVAVADLTADQGAGNAAENRGDYAAFLRLRGRRFAALLARLGDALIDRRGRYDLRGIDTLARSESGGAEKAGDHGCHGCGLVHGGLLGKFCHSH